MQLIANSTSALPQVAEAILGYANNQKVFLFYGSMGAGKTTLIKQLCKSLGSADNIASPTFSIVNEYAAPGGAIYHFDFYRLKNESEALDMGCEEYFYSGNYCFIEWPEKIPGLLPNHYISIQIEVSDDGLRKFGVEHF